MFGKSFLKICFPLLLLIGVNCARDDLFNQFQNPPPEARPFVRWWWNGDCVEEGEILRELDVMKEATGQLLKGELEVSGASRVHEGLLTESERSGVLALHGLLREKDPNHEHLGLKRLPTYTGDYLWLCDTHYQLMQPKIPEKIR